MNTTLYLIKLGEISLKGNNRNFFEKILRRNIKRKLKGYKNRLETQKGRMFLFVDQACPQSVVDKALSTTFGIQGYSKAVSTSKDFQSVQKAVLALVDENGFSDKTFTFKAEARRSDKSYPLTSYQICCEIGGAVLDNFTGSRVDIHNPELTISLEIRNQAFIYLSPRKGLGGLPVGCAGKGLLLLSGGIDSPVAGYRMAKRGLRQDAIYFHTYPYTSDEAHQKVITLGEKISRFIPGLRLFTVPFTDIQLHINRMAKPEEHTLHMRYAMVKVANGVAAHINAKCLVTGEALSQVASQTLESITFTDSASADLVIMRPLIGLDKEEIITTAKVIDTYKTSILPYEDCCTIFSPAHPLVRPDKEIVTKSYLALKLEDKIEEAITATLEQKTIYEMKQPD